MSVRFGILSTAHINRLVLAGARGADGIDVAAVASRDRDRAEAYAREHSIPRAYGSYEELLADPELDAVYISLPNSLHVDWSIRALEAGKHVLCEKPLTRHSEAAERAFDVAERTDRILTEAFMYRYNPQTARLRQLVEDGQIGALRVVRSAFSFTITGAANIRLAADLDGGALMDVGCYCVSGSRLMAGEPERVYGVSRDEGGVDVAFAATMWFPDEVVAQFDCGLRLPMRDELELVGEEGSIFLDDPWHCRIPVIELRRDGAVDEIRLEPVDSYRLELENLAAAIRGEVEPLLGREDAVAQARALEALYRSAATGEAVEV